MIGVPGGILCAGNLTQDIVVWPVEDVVFNTTAWVNDIITSIGGNGANTSSAIARMGGSVRLTGLVGDDETGRKVIEELAASGVDVSHVGRHPLPTPLTVALVRPDGARSFLHRPGASRQAFAEPIGFTTDLISGCTHFHLANPFAMPLLRRQTGLTMERAKAAGLTTSLDTGWDALGEWIGVVGPSLPYLNILFANEDESLKLSGEAGPEAGAAFFHDRGVETVVIKLGDRGCFVSDAGQTFRSPAFRITPVDTTGAGDSFAGAFLVGLQRALPPADAARLANAAGALSVLKPGGTAGLRDYEGTLAWIAGQQ